MSSPPPTPRRARVQLSSAPLVVANHDPFQPARRPIPDHYIPVAREPGGRSYSSGEGGLASPLQFGFTPSGRTFISNPEGAPGSHDRLYESRKPEGEDSGDSSWDSEAEYTDPEEEKKQTRLRRRYADHHRQAYHNGDPLERRLSHPDPDSRPNGPAPNPSGQLTPRPVTPSGDILHNHQVDFVNGLREAVARLPPHQVTDQHMLQLHRARIPHDWALRNQASRRGGHGTLQGIGIRRDKGRLARAEESRKRRQSMDQEERMEDRKRRGSDASR